MITLKRPEEIREAARDPKFRMAARELLWARGKVLHLLRPGGQTKLYRFFHSTKPGPAPIVASCHRRLGKSFLALALAVGRCLESPGAQVKYAAPDKEQCRTIVEPNLQVLLRSCPKKLRPRKKGDTYEFLNPHWASSEPSVLEIRGVNFRRGDHLRGAACDLFVADEAREYEHLEYLLSDVISYQFLGRRDPRCFLISTPPATAAHPLAHRYIPEAMTRGRYLSIPASENPDFTSQDEELVLEFCGSKESTSWAREAECQIVTEESEAIVPEFARMKGQVVRGVKVPEHFVPLVCFDSGWEDYTHILFGFVDFPRQVLCVLDELRFHYTTTGDLARELVRKERALWGGSEARRYADATPQQLADLRRDWGLAVEPAQKHDRAAALASLRDGILSGRVEVDPRCHHLIFQLSHGIHRRGRDGRFTGWARSEALGHSDGIAALVYLYRSAPWRRNPVRVRRPARSADLFFTESFDDRPRSPLGRALSRSIHG